MPDIAWSIQRVVWPDHVTETVRALADRHAAAWIEGAGWSAPSHGGHSLIAVRPVARLEQTDGADALFSVDGRIVETDPSCWMLWRRIHRRLGRWPQTRAGLGPGWIGAISFEAAHGLERLPPARDEPLGMPVLRMDLYDAAVILNYARQEALLVQAQGLRERLSLPPMSIQAWCERWEAAVASKDVTSAPPQPTASVRFLAPTSTYEAAVRRALEHIASGDIYQVNIAQCIQLEGIGDALARYADLRRANPAPCAAFLDWGDACVASVSPELFLRLRGRDVLTRPIKGTRPRTGDPAADEAHRRSLIESRKEAAELAMIVDLHRNDLGRVCEYGSVRVPRPRALEAHPTVFHTVADVTGRLAEGRDGLDLLAACSPAGSISGVPKIRAIEIITELEPVARGVYTGAIGNLALDGDLTFNVAIRTLQFRGQAGTLYVGGGIVADSDPADEYEETLAKARGILRGLGVTAIGAAGERAERARFASTGAAP